MKIFYIGFDRLMRESSVSLLFIGIFLFFLVVFMGLFVLVIAIDFLRDGFTGENIKSLLGILFLSSIFIYMFSGIFKGIFKSIKIGKKCDSLIKNINIKEDRVIFPMALNVEEGFFEAKGSIKSKGNSSTTYYDVKSKFISKNKRHVKEIEFKDEPFFFSIDRGGIGEIRLPGIRIMDEQFNNCLILYAKPNYSVSFPQEKISVSYENDYAELIVSKTGNGFRGSLYVPQSFSKAKKAIVQIGRNKIVETKESTRFEHKFMEEFLIVVSHYDFLSPLLLYKELKPGSFELSSIREGHGNFMLSLSLDIPFKQDVIESLTCTVEPIKEK